MGLFVKCHLKLHIDIILHYITLSSDFFYISLQKRKKLWSLCNSVTDLQKIWHNDAEWSLSALTFKN